MRALPLNAVGGTGSSLPAMRMQKQGLVHGVGCLHSVDMRPAGKPEEDLSREA